jgi:uncharacterized protein YjiS (DUF1127 family)
MLKQIETIFSPRRHQTEKKHLHVPWIKAATVPTGLPPGKRMETTMASKPITYPADLEISAPHGFAAWLSRVAPRAVRTFAQELRIRRDTRQLMAMSDRMLKDIGLSRAEIGGAVRYGRD